MSRGCEDVLDDERLDEMTLHLEIRRKLWEN
jgi:hypothetical protein